MTKSFFEAIAVLVGTTIGAGVLGIPYVIAKAGFLTGLITIVFVGLMIIILNLYLGEVCSRTKGRHQLVGYAERYLGKWGKVAMSFSSMTGAYGALIAYMLGVSYSLNNLIGVNKIVAMLIFFAVASFLVYLGLKTIAHWEFIVNGLVLLIILFIFFISFSHFNVSNLVGFSMKGLLLPYGVIFFAFIGTAAIPDMKSLLEHSKERLKKAVIIGSLIPLAAYVIFTVGVLAVTGAGTTEIATIGLGEVLGNYMLIIGNLFACLAMFTSFLAIGLALLWIYQYDYKLKKGMSWFLTVFPPLAVALSGLAGFVQVIGITGAVAGGVEGILIVMMHRRAKKFGEVAPSYVIKERWIVSALLCIVFVGGIVYTIANLF